MEVVVLNDELAPGEVVVRMTHIDYLSKLLSDLLDDVKHLLLVGLEVPLFLVRVDQVLLNPAQSQLVLVSDQLHHEWQS